METLSRTSTEAASVASPTLEYVTPAEAAQVMRCKPWDVVHLIHDGLIVASRPVGPLGPWIIRRAELARYVERAATPQVGPRQFRSHPTSGTRSASGSRRMTERHFPDVSRAGGPLLTGDNPAAASASACTFRLMTIQGAITAATQCEACGRIGQLEIFHMSGSGQGVRAAVPCDGPMCSGRMWTIGRYGVPSVEGELQTVLLQARPDELRLLSDLASKVASGEAGIEAVVTELEHAGTPTARAIADWVRDNEANFAAASALIALLTLLCQLIAGSGDTTTNIDIDVDRIIVRDDGRVVLRQE